MGEPSKEEHAAVAASHAAIAEAEAVAAAADGAAGGAVAVAGAAVVAVAAGVGDAADRFGAAAGEKTLRIADCCPVRSWAFLLGALPKVRYCCVDRSFVCAGFVACCAVGAGVAGRCLAVVGVSW